MSRAVLLLAFVLTAVATLGVGGPRDASAQRLGLQPGGNYVVHAGPTLPVPREFMPPQITGTVTTGAGDDDPFILRFDPDPGALPGITGIELFRSTSEDGASVTAANYFVDGTEFPVTIAADANGRPVHVRTPEGEAYELVYSDTGVEVHYLLPDGQFGVVTQPMPPHIATALARLSEGRRSHTHVPRGLIPTAFERPRPAQEDPPPTPGTTLLRSLAVTVNVDISGNVSVFETYRLGGSRIRWNWDGGGDFAPPKVWRFTRKSPPLYPESGRLRETEIFVFEWEVALEPETAAMARIGVCTTGREAHGSRINEGLSRAGIAADLVEAVTPLGRGLASVQAAAGVAEDASEPKVATECRQDVKDRFGSVSFLATPQQITFTVEHPFIGVVGAQTVTVLFADDPEALDKPHDSRRQSLIFTGKMVIPPACRAPGSPPFRLNPDRANRQLKEAELPVFDPASVFAVPGVSDCESAIELAGPQGPHWVRSNAMINPAGIDLHWDEPASSALGSFTTCAPSEGSLVIRSFNQHTNGTFYADYTFTWTFSTPPPIIFPNEPWPISISGTGAGTALFRFPASSFQFAIAFPSYPQGPDSPPVYQTYNAFGPYLLIGSLGLPPAASEDSFGWRLGAGGTEVRIRAAAAGHGAGGCAVEWTYHFVPAAGA